MDVAVFHRAFLGRGLDHTPAMRRLYEAFPAARGFSVLPDTKLSGEPLLATLVLAFAQTQPSEARRVYLFVPRQDRKWVEVQARALVRHAYQSRKGDAKASRWLTKAAEQLVPMGVTWQTLQTGAPTHWVAFNFHREAQHISGWLQDGLIEATDG